MKPDPLIQSEKEKRVPHMVQKTDAENPLSAEVVPDNPDPIPPDVLQEISTSEKLVTGLEDMGVESNLILRTRWWNRHLRDIPAFPLTAGAADDSPGSVTLRASERSRRAGIRSLAAGQPARGVAVLGVGPGTAAGPGVCAACYTAACVAVGGAGRGSRGGLGRGAACQASAGVTVSGL